MNIECCGPLIEIELEIQEVFEGSNGGDGDTDEEKDYVGLINKPSINEVTLQGDKTFGDLGMLPLTNIEILKIINKAEN